MTTQKLEIAQYKPTAHAYVHDYNKHRQKLIAEGLMQDQWREYITTLEKNTTLTPAERAALRKPYLDILEREAAQPLTSQEREEISTAHIFDLGARIMSDEINHDQLFITYIEKLAEKTKSDRFAQRKTFLADVLDEENERSFVSHLKSQIQHINSPEAQSQKYALRGPNKMAELAQIAVMDQLTKETDQLLKTVQEAYARAKKDNNQQWMFELEQVMGSIMSLYEHQQHLELKPNHRVAFDKDALSEYNNRVQELNENIDAMQKLGEHLLKQRAHPWMRRIGVGLIVLGILAVVAFVLLASVPSFGAAFAVALASANMLGASTAIGTAFGMSVTAAGPGGMALVGAAIGAALTAIGTTLFFYRRNEEHTNRAVAEATKKIGATKKAEVLSEDELLQSEILEKISDILHACGFLDSNPMFVFEKALARQFDDPKKAKDLEKTLLAKLTEFDQKVLQRPDPQPEVLLSRRMPYRSSSPQGSVEDDDEPDTFEANAPILKQPLTEVLHELGAICGIPVIEPDVWHQKVVIYDNAWVLNAEEPESEKGSAYRSFDSAMSFDRKPFTFVDALEPYVVLGIDATASQENLKQSLAAALHSSRSAPEKSTLQELGKSIQAMPEQIQELLKKKKVAVPESVITPLLRAYIKKLENNPEMLKSQPAAKKLEALRTQLMVSAQQLTGLSDKPLDLKALGQICGCVVLEIPQLEGELGSSRHSVNYPGEFVEFTTEENEREVRRYVVVSSDEVYAALNVAPTSTDTQLQDAFLRRKINQVMSNVELRMGQLPIARPVGFGVALRKKIQRENPTLEQRDVTMTKENYGAIMKTLEGIVTFLDQQQRSNLDQQQRFKGGRNVPPSVESLITLGQHCGVLAFPLPADFSVSLLTQWSKAKSTGRDRGYEQRPDFMEIVDRERGQRFVMVTNFDDSHALLGVRSGCDEASLQTAYVTLKAAHVKEIEQKYSIPGLRTFGSSGASGGSQWHDENTEDDEHGSDIGSDMNA